MCIRLDLVVVALYLLHHDVIALLVLEFVDDGDFFVSLFLRTYLCMIHDDFGMENLLVYPLTEIVGHGTDKRTLLESGNLGSRDEGVFLCI